MTTAPASFKQMIKDGIIKRADAMKVRYADIHVEPGFNLRERDEEFEAGIQDLTAYILGGGYIPPLEVRPHPEGRGVIIVDGHRRHIAIGRAIEQGAPIEYVSVVAFVGNDADRVARIMTSNEGVKLRPLEVAEGYKRLAAFGLSPEEIGRKVNKTRQHVEQMLILAHANRDVHALVKSGAVSASVAIEAVRKHGEKAGEFLARMLGKAKASGKGRVTAGVVRGKSIPREIVARAVDAIDALAETLSAESRAALLDGKIANDAPVVLQAWIVRDLLEQHAAIIQAREKQAQRERERADKAAQMDIEEAA